MHRLRYYQRFGHGNIPLTIFLLLNRGISKTVISVELLRAARTGKRRPKGAAAGAARSGLQMPGVAPGAKWAPAAHLKFFLDLLVMSGLTEV